MTARACSTLPINRAEICILFKGSSTSLASILALNFAILKEKKRSKERNPKTIDKSTW